MNATFARIFGLLAAIGVTVGGVNALTLPVPTAAELDIIAISPFVFPHPYGGLCSPPPVVEILLPHVADGEVTYSTHRIGRYHDWGNCID
jgi:hypothetical protein